MRKSSQHRPAPATVKRSITISSEVDAQVRKTAGAGGYSAFINDAALMALQAQGIREWIAEFEAEHGAISEAEMQDARRRRAIAARDARR